jgi:protein phosphatase-4 regulatory subunit 3
MGFTRCLQRACKRLTCPLAAAIKFVRAVLQVNDDFYHRHIIKHDLFKPIFVKLRECSNKDNLLTSQVIEMIEYIKQENLKSLIAYIVEKYSESFREVSHVDTFDKLQQRCGAQRASVLHAHWLRSSGMRNIRR